MNPVIIDGSEFKLLRDEDQGNFHRLTFKGKITYLECRVNGILLEPCRAAMASAIVTDTGLILVTSICAGISAAATFLKGRKAHSGEDEAFLIDFIRAYMDSVLMNRGPSTWSSWAQWLYKDVRCGLAHNFTILTGGMKLQEIGAYVQMTPRGAEMHAPTLLDDFQRGWPGYVKDVWDRGETSELGELFQKRFDEIFHD